MIGPLKQWAEGVTQIMAEEMRALGDFLKTVGKPGLISYATADLAKPAQVGVTTEIELTDFAAGDALLTCGALCTAFYARTIDFATAGPAGGALPAGTYKLYLRVMAGGTAANRYYEAYVLATAESEAYGVEDSGHADAYYKGTIDEEIYLVVGENIAWDGAALTPEVAPGDWDVRAGKWGIIDLIKLTRGDFGEALIQDDRVLGIEALALKTALGTGTPRAGGQYSDNLIVATMDCQTAGFGASGFNYDSIAVDNVAGTVTITLKKNVHAKAFSAFGHTVPGNTPCMNPYFIYQPGVNTLVIVCSTAADADLGWNVAAFGEFA